MLVQFQKIGQDLREINLSNYLDVFHHIFKDYAYQWVSGSMAGARYPELKSKLDGFYDCDALEIRIEGRYCYFITPNKVCSKESFFIGLLNNSFFLSHFLIKLIIDKTIILNQQVTHKELPNSLLLFI